MFLTSSYYVLNTMGCWGSKSPNPRSLKGHFTIVSQFVYKMWHETQFLLQFSVYFSDYMVHIYSKAGKLCRPPLTVQWWLLKYLDGYRYQDHPIKRSQLTYIN